MNAFAAYDAAYESLATRFGEEFATSVVDEIVAHVSEDEVEAELVAEADRLLHPWKHVAPPQMLDTDIPF